MLTPYSKMARLAQGQRSRRAKRWVADCYQVLGKVNFFKTKNTLPPHQKARGSLMIPLSLVDNS